MAPTRAAVPVTVQIAHQLAVEFQEVGSELDHVTEARIAGTGIVDGDPHTPGQPRFEVATKLVVVLHGLLLGELDDQALGELVEQIECSGHSQQGGAQVDEQQPVLGGGPEAGGRGQAGDLELLPQPDLLRPGQPPVGRPHRVERHAGQGFIAHNELVGRPDHRLGQGFHHPGLAQELDGAPHRAGAVQLYAGVLVT